MKCIQCSHDCKYKERADRKCPQCGTAFAFEPRTGDPFTDAFFQAAIDRVSAKGSVRWGVEHLYYEVCRRSRRPSLAPAIVPFALSALLALSPIGAWALLAGGIFSAAVLAMLMKRGRTYVRIDKERFATLWVSWVSAHGTPKAVIARKPRQQRPQARTLEADIALYSFDRAVICDRARSVDLLLANNFHFENNCAVLAIGGYPEQAFETVRSMLRKNPKLLVFALHDATIEGCEMATQLASDPAWFKDSGRVIDIGLRPAQAAGFAGLWLPEKKLPLPSPSLTPAEARWLSRNALELAAIRPEQVIKRLFRAISRQTDSPSASTDTGSFVDTTSFVGDATSSDGGGDSFG